MELVEPSVLAYNLTVMEIDTMGKTKQAVDVNKSNVMNSNSNIDTTTPPPTLTEEQQQSIADGIKFDGLKIGGKARDTMELIAKQIAETTDNSAVADAIALIMNVAKDSGVVANGGTRSTNADDSPQMVIYRTEFAELCKKHCKQIFVDVLDADGKVVMVKNKRKQLLVSDGGFTVDAHGNRQYYFIDANGIKRFPKSYIKAEKKDTSADDKVTDAELIAEAEAEVITN